MGTYGNDNYRPLPLWQDIAHQVLHRPGLILCGDVMTYASVLFTDELRLLLRRYDLAVLSTDSEMNAIVTSTWADPEGVQGVRTLPWNCKIINFCHVEIFRQTPSENLPPPPPPTKFSGSAHGLPNNLSRLVGKPTTWFSNRSDTNQGVQSQKIALEARNFRFRK